MTSVQLEVQMVVHLTIDEASLAIAGGFGKVVLGMDDDAADSYNIDEMDLIAEEPSAGITSSSISMKFMLFHQMMQ